MKKTTFIALSLFLLALTNTLSAQFGMGKPDDIEQLKKRTLIVIVEKPSEKLIKKLTKKGKTADIDAYKAAVDEYNTNMQQVIEKFWKFSTGKIEYKSADELKKINNKKNYALIYCNSGGASNFSSGYDESDGLTWDVDIKDETPSVDKFTLFSVALLEKNSPIYHTTLPDIFPTKADLTYGLLTTTNYFNYRLSHKKVSRSDIEDQIKENQPLLKTKTLLLQKDLMDKKLTPSEIKAAYPYKYELADDNEIDEHVVNADPNYAYALIVPAVNSGLHSNSIIFYQVVINCEDGSTLAMSMPSMGSMMLASKFGSKSGHSVFTKNTLMDFCKYINDKKKK